MATSDHIDVVEAVKDSLNAATTMTTDFVARRSYFYNEMLEDIRSVDVIVQQLGHEWSDVSRQRSRLHDYTVGVIVLAPVEWDGGDESGPRKADMDACTLLCEDIQDHLEGAGSMASCTLMSGVNEPIWAQDALQNLHIFLSQIEFTYRGLRT